MDMHQAENWSVFKETIRTNNDTEGKFDLFSSFFFSFFHICFLWSCMPRSRTENLSQQS